MAFMRQPFMRAPGGARFKRVKGPNPPGSGKEIAEGKGVRREAESEGSRMWEQTNYGQTSGLTNRNRIMVVSCVSKPDSRRAISVLKISTEDSRE